MFSTYKQRNKKATFIQRTSTSTFRLDCLQRSLPKAVKAFNIAEFLFLEIYSLYKLPSEVSSHLLMAKVFNYIELASSRSAAMIRKQIKAVRARCLVGYGIKISR